MRINILKKLIFSKVFICFVLLIASCASSSSNKKGALSLEKAIESSNRKREMNERILMSASSFKREAYADYKIGPEDLIEISVFEDEKLNKTVRVSSQGNINFPLLGIVKVKGLTVRELEKEIRDLLEAKYLKHPNVSIFIKEYRNQRISVLGAVEKPGTFEVTGQRTILDILTMSGGLKEDAGQLLFITRFPRLEDRVSEIKTEVKETLPKTFIVDLEELLMKGDFNLNIPLIHGDIINIPVSGKIYVSGEVRSPGGFPLTRRKLTVNQAIIQAGGLKTEANGSETKILRYSRDGKEIIEVNAYAIQKGKAEDIYLKENDIIFVPKSGIKIVLQELWDFLKGHITGGINMGTAGAAAY